MAGKDLSNRQAIGIGCLVAIGASILVFVLPFSVYFLQFMIKFVTFAFPLSIMGAVIGRYISRTRLGSFVGAAIVVVVEFWLIFSFASMLPLD